MHVLVAITMSIGPPWNTFLSISTLIANATVENRLTYDELVDKTVLKLLIPNCENNFPIE